MICYVLIWVLYTGPYTISYVSIERSGILYADSSLVYTMVYDATHIGTKKLILNMYRYGGLILTMCVMRGFLYTKGYIALTTYQLRSGIQMGSERRGDQGADEASSPLDGGPGLENSMAGALLCQDNW